ncbi:ABC transporter permease [Corynebacterium gerontici]
MWRVGWRSVMAHKVRFGLTVMAVVLGTAFVAGSLMFTSALSATFDQALNKAFYNIDAVAKAGSQPITQEDLARVRELPEVTTAYVHDTTSVVIAKEGERSALQTGAMQTSVGVWYEDSSKSDEAVVDTVTLYSGAAPQGDAEVALPESQMAMLGVNVGDRIIAVSSSGQFTYTISGTYTDSGIGEPGVELLMAEPAYLERYEPGGISTMLVRSDPLDDQAMVDLLKQQFPGMDVRTGTQFADDVTGSFKESMAFVTYFLVAFGLIALVVGTFIIANTFSMLVAQRTKEFALLRALGISKGQLRRSVTFEAIIVGVVGSLLGVLGGIGLVAGIRAIMSAAGLELSGMGLGVTPRSVVVPLILGVVVTVISAWAPARKASSVHPVEAMRQGSGAVDRLKVRTGVGVVLLLLGIVFSVSGVLFDDQPTKTRASLVGIGALASVLGVFFASAAASIPLVGLIGKALGAPFGSVGRLAQTNARRTPKRTATTAFALTLGVALVTLIGMFSATLDNSIRDISENELKVDYILMGPGTGELPLPQDVIDRVKGVEGVGNVSETSYAIASLGQPPSSVAGQNPGSFLSTMSGNAADVYNVDGVDGSLDLSEPNRLVVRKDIAQERNWQLGQKIPLFNANGAPIAEVEVSGMFDAAKAMNPITVSQATFDGKFATTSVVALFVNGDGSKSPEELRQSLEQAVEGSLYVRVQTPEEFADAQASLVKNMMNILYGLLGLAVIIAIIGIINTLALNVIERRQEIGMLRAVGMHRKQVRGMITLESVQIALYGAVIGILLGLGIGTAFLKVLASQGLDSLALPTAEIIWVLIGAAIVGVLAAVWPAQRAASTPPLEAMVD